MAGETITIAGDPCSVPLAKKLGDAFTKKTGITVDVSSFSCQAGISKATGCHPFYRKLVQFLQAYIRYD